MGKIFYLDLSKNELLGWEREKSKLAVKAIIDGIIKGVDFPAVPVIKINGDKYALCRDVENKFGRCDGGHHRAVGHYLAGEELKCELIGELNEDYPLFFPIREIALVDREH